jgi:peptidoglycan hydrolase CwlO-like protein
VADQTDRLGDLPTWADAMRRLRELAAQMTSAAQAAAVAGAKATPPVLAQPLARYADQLLAVSAVVTNPLRRLLDEQERLVEMMAEWAEQHRQLSEQIADWADQQRSLSEQMIELARPLLDQSAMIESLQAEWSGRSAESEAPAPPAKRAAKKAPASKRPATKPAARKASTRRR